MLTRKNEPVSFSEVAKRARCLKSFAGLIVSFLAMAFV